MDPNWDRAPDGTIIRVYVAEQISKQAAMQALEPWLSGYSGKYICNNDANKDSRRFVLKFTGPSGVAKTRVSKALESLRDGDRNWRVFEAQIPSNGGNGGSNGDGTRAVKLSISRDKSRKQVAKEIAGKRLKIVLQQSMPSKRFYFSKYDGKVSCEWIPIARVEPTEDKSVSIEWNNSSPLIAEFDKKEIVSRFRDSGRVPVQETWSI